ncbi:MAG: hypothetical protein A2086_10525 [Spirochaetes bacterium GWD1_27_9]|nr:MAG: hypothetical protein A2Z98_17760 [Spirochaetes bacterium GWB1_27_13]OHD21221.1 MAG: hypothetical protein A2Y34_08510 [Spirochaetes bacterium GWC1_27_15]OHD30911.1 MAG: hypothetical protein A2086_10525 [Spirochaetes bacterium GWD1_27_9]
MEQNLNALSTRKGFNTALKHFKIANKIIKSIEGKNNLADLVNEAIENKQIQQYQLAPILNALLIDKYSYYSESFNLKATYQGHLSAIADQIASWDKIDIVLCYFHPQLGQTLINPKNKDLWETVDQLKENELVVIYAGYYNEKFDIEFAKKACKSIKSIIHNEKVSNLKIFKTETTSTQKIEEPKKETKVEKVEQPKKVVKEEQVIPVETVVPQTQQSQAKKKLSPHYGVIVSNELFHNGNVEAWKKIIASYETKYPDTKVLVFYEGEQIQDINTLFKWGKVKHGTNIYFALLGPEFRDISKLRRYLAQGASNRFEDFLKGDPTKVLVLF